jgi:hypothetical protein
MNSSRGSSDAACLRAWGRERETTVQHRRIAGKWEDGQVASVPLSSRSAQLPSRPSDPIEGPRVGSRISAAIRFRHSAEVSVVKELDFPACALGDFDPPKPTSGLRGGTQRRGCRWHNQRAGSWNVEQPGFRRTTWAAPEGSRDREKSRPGTARRQPALRGGGVVRLTAALFKKLLFRVQTSKLECLREQLLVEYRDRLRFPGLKAGRPEPLVPRPEGRGFYRRAAPRHARRARSPVFRWRVSS